MNALRLFALGTVAAIAVSAPLSGARADDFTPHHLVPKESYSHLTPEQRLEVRRYMNYEYREPCQNYREVPEGFYRDGCRLTREKPEPVAEVAPQPAPAPILTPVVATYDLLFGFNSAVIEAGAYETLDRIAREITTYNPGEVTVSGHADRSGPADYNVRLSERRAQAISNALTERGVPNHVIDQKAFGESAPAVETKDGVRLRENRRVVVNFHK